MKLWKLTNSTGKTYQNTQWGENVSHSATGRSTTLCSDGFIHAYRSKWIAVFMNPEHANFEKPLLWEARGKVVIEDKDLKCGCKTLTTIKQHPLSFLTVEERIKIGIYSALTVCEKESFVTWAKNWLNKKDRSHAHATAACAAAFTIASSANAACNAAHAVACAACAAAYTVASAASTACDVSYAAAARYAACAVSYAAIAYPDFKLLPIIQKVLKQRKVGDVK